MRAGNSSQLLETSEDARRVMRAGNSSQVIETNERRLYSSTTRGWGGSRFISRQKRLRDAATRLRRADRAALDRRMAVRHPAAALPPPNPAVLHEKALATPGVGERCAQTQRLLRQRLLLQTTSEAAGFFV